MVKLRKWWPSVANYNQTNLGGSQPPPLRLSRFLVGLVVGFAHFARELNSLLAGDQNTDSPETTTKLPQNSLPFLIFCFFGVPLFSTNQSTNMFFLPGVQIPAKKRVIRDALGSA